MFLSSSVRSVISVEGMGTGIGLSDEHGMLIHLFSIASRMATSAERSATAFTSLLCTKGGTYLQVWSPFIQCHAGAAKSKVG